ncbi:MAG: hypothetical protein AYK22_04945 [Thermoplasmatales archaeon SG8-52-3]|nr:MAG: hypothetical protein AYK22_04945 [Thermoplasmatales archaeon SG8-52-3]
MKNDNFDMIIITSTWFESSLYPLVEHKNIHNIKTVCISCRDIYRSIYFDVEGRDNAEKIKYFIKSAYDNWGIKYVLLIGGRRGGLFKPTWWVPVRYSNVVAWYKEPFLCDLYFADIYDTEGNFSSWDSNGNGIFAEWDENGKDILDMYPEVCVGRLPCKNIEELEIIVDKIINYENTAYGSEWFYKYVGIAGDTWPEQNDFYEGEMITEAAFDYLIGFESSYLWTSTGSFKDKQDVIDEVNKGCGFLVFCGHGDPMIWGTYPPHEKEWIDGPLYDQMDEFINGEKLPITLVGGCNNAQFDVSFLNFIKGVLEKGLKYFIKYPGIPQGYYEYDWGSKCWAWSMVTVKDGGCVAIMGNTGLSYSMTGEQCLSKFEGFLIQQFFRSYQEGKDTLGDAYNSQLIYYMDIYPSMINRSDCKVVQEWTLLGDPSLKIGGY